MNQQILKIEADPKDANCLKITLRQPSRYRLFRSNKTTEIVTYKGYGRNWYCLPSFKPAPNNLIPLLKDISRGQQFKHLRTKLS